MTDMASSFKNAIVAALHPNIKWLWCSFHVSQAVIKGIIERIPNTNKKIWGETTTKRRSINLLGLQDKRKSKGFITG